jgi:FixJ family two-component response regulator
MDVSRRIAMNDFLHRPHSPTDARTKKALIGIVDANESSRDFIRILASSAGYRWAAFESIDAFLNSGFRDGVDCLVLDLDIPGSEDQGWERQLAQIDLTIPIIFLTGRASVLTTIALKDGAEAILVKPFTDEDLLGAIRASLDFPGLP